MTTSRDRGGGGRAPFTRDGGLMVALLGLAGFVIGCAAPLKMSDPADYVPPESLAAVPPFVRSFAIDANGEAIRKRDEEQAAAEALEASINYNMRAHGARYFSVGALRDVGNSPFPAWTAETLFQILHEQHRRQKGHETKHQAVREWRYSHPGLDMWRDHLGADYVLVGIFLDGQNTTGRSVSNVLAAGFGGWVVDARREGLACVVNLIDGRVVWCALLPFNGLSVRDRGGAQQFVDQLTAGLFAMTPPPGTRPPPPPVQPATPAGPPPSAASPPSGPRASGPNPLDVGSPH